MPSDFDDDFDTFDDTPEPAPAQPANRAERRKKGRKRAAVPEGAPEPQDHLPKKDARASEATGGATIVLDLWDETFEIDQTDLLESWDFQIGTVNGNPLQMVKGLLGPAKFAWFATRARAEGKSPLGAATEVMQMFARETGFDSAGK